MRISDWSSDVCSSDLRWCARERAARAAGRCAGPAVGNLVVPVDGMSAIEVPVRSAPTLPPEAPLDMPVQSLRTGRLRGRRLPPTPGGMVGRRAAVIGAAIGPTIMDTYHNRLTPAGAERKRAGEGTRG